MENAGNGAKYVEEATKHTKVTKGNGLIRRAALEAEHADELLNIGN